MRPISNSRNRTIAPGASQNTNQALGNQIDAVYARKRRIPEETANAQVAAGGGGGQGTGSSSGTTLYTSVYVKDINSALCTTLTAAASFTIGAVGSGATVEVVYNTGPDRFQWSASDFTAGKMNIRLFLSGYSGIVPYDSGAAAWTWDHSGTGDTMDTVTVTKPAGGPVPGDLGDFKGRIYLEIQQPG